jgi:hypothetical protein
MENHFDATSEPRKEWVAPELKKIDVEEITAGSFSSQSSDAQTSFS